MNFETCINTKLSRDENFIHSYYSWKNLFLYQIMKNINQVNERVLFNKVIKTAGGEFYENNEISLTHEGAHIIATKNIREDEVIMHGQSVFYDLT
jgi:hypothetical protein